WSPYKRGEMIGLLQRVTEARVTVEGNIVASIGRGLLVLVAVTREDTEEAVSRLTDRILGYRVFPDDRKRMNLSVEDLGLELLLVPQFTLAADTRKGRRASFTGAADPETGARFFDLMVKLAAERLSRVESGIFGADMQVALVNDGP